MYPIQMSFTVQTPAQLSALIAAAGVTTAALPEVETPKAEKPKAEPKKEAAPAPEPQPAPAQSSGITNESGVSSAPSDTGASIEDVKGPFLQLVAKDRPKAVGLLNEYGASKLTEVPANKLDELLTKISAALGV